VAATAALYEPMNGDGAHVSIAAKLTAKLGEDSRGFQHPHFSSIRLTARAQTAKVPKIKRGLGRL